MFRVRFILLGLGLGLEVRCSVRIMVVVGVMARLESEQRGYCAWLGIVSVNVRS